MGKKARQDRQDRRKAVDEWKSDEAARRRANKQFEEAQAREIASRLRASRKSNKAPVKWTTLGYVLRKKSPKAAASKEIYSALHDLNEMKRHWVRPVETWKKTGKSPKAVFLSLANHLLAKYPVPQFLWNYFLVPRGEDNGEVGRELARMLGAGISLLPKKNHYVKECIPVPLTKRMWHLFPQAPGSCNLYLAVRRAQVLGMGGSSNLWKSLENMPLGRRFFNPEDEVFYATVVQWFCNHPFIAPNQIGPLWDYLIHQKVADPTYSMKGRAANNLLVAMEVWHQELAKTRAVQEAEFDPSGFVEAEWITKERLQGTKEKIEVYWEIKELLSAKALANEGRRLKHCVYSYSRSVKAGRISIWSMRKDGMSVLTIEVHNRYRKIVQVRGKYNRMAKISEKKAIGRWAVKAGLSSGVW